MSNLKQLEFFPTETEILTKRQFNIVRSPKQNGTAGDDSKPYLAELGITITDNPQHIQFLKNTTDVVHRWSPYVQGFSSSFVQRKLEEYKNDYYSPVIFDPFAGSGTVLVQSKLNNYEVYGVELNPLLHFVANVKLNTWNTNPQKLFRISNDLPQNCIFEAPEF